MGLAGRKPVLPFLPMPQRGNSHDMPVFAFPSSASASGTSTPCYSDNGYPGSGMSLPHTPLPGTPLGLEKYWPLMITPTPTHNTPFSFDFPTQQPQSATCLPPTTTKDGSLDSPGSTGSAGTLTGLEDEHVRSGRQGKRLASTWSMESSVVDEDDGLEWDDREEGILLSFLDNPLHPLATPYPPGTLPPSSALDDITSQIIRFHSPPTPVGGSYLNLSEMVAAGGGGQEKPRSALGITTSISAPSLPSSAARRHAATAGSKHRRTHSASGIPWTHSWGATRRKLYEIARREALGSNREDRFKGRVISPPMVTTTKGGGDEFGSELDASTVSTDCMSTPLCVPRSTVPSSTTSAIRNSQNEGEEVTETPSGRIMKRPGGGIMMQRHGSETMLEFPGVAALVGTSSTYGLSSLQVEEEGAQRQALEGKDAGGVRGIGQALRLSSSLQRSTKGPMSEVVKPVHPTSGRPRKPSLLQRGQSFTADDFNNCLTLSSDSGASNDDDEPEVEFTQFADQDCVTPSAVWDSQTPTLATHHVGSSTSARNRRQQDLFDDMFGQQQNGMLSPSSSSISGSEAFHETSDDTEMIPATPDQTFALPCILLTKTSPTPGIHARNGSGSSDLEMVSAPSVSAGSKASCGLGTPLNLSPPGSPLARPQHHGQQVPSLVLDLERTPRPVITPNVARPGLIRARSSAAAYATPSAFSQFMNNAPLAAQGQGHLVGGDLSDMPPPNSSMAEVPPSLPRSMGGLGLSQPTAKRQKIGYTHPQLTIPFAAFGGAGDDGGLASPFDEKKMF